MTSELGTIVRSIFLLTLNFFIDVFVRPIFNIFCSYLRNIPHYLSYCILTVYRYIPKSVLHSVLNPCILELSRLYFVTVTVAFNAYHFFFTKQIVVPEPTNPLLKFTICQLHDKILKRKITVKQIIESYIERIEVVNPLINAVAVKNYQEARSKARCLDNLIAKMSVEELVEHLESHPLFGIPFTMKDAIEVEGKVITCGIYNRSNTVCEKTALVVHRMKAAGGILLAITNVPEMCLWVESTNTVYGRSCNPYDTRRMTGGSSGGEGALIAVAGSLIGIGSDIGGSIRMPCFFNGIFGLTPSPGLVPLDGHIPQPVGFRHEMLRIGPMCRYASDMPRLLRIMAGDSEIPQNINEKLDMSQLNVYYMEGISRNPLIQTVSYDMRKAVETVAQYFELKHHVSAHRIDFLHADLAMEFFATSMEAPPGEPLMAQLVLSVEGTGGTLNCLRELPKWVLGRSRHTLAGITTGLLDGATLYSDRKKKQYIQRRNEVSDRLKKLLGDDGILIFPSWPCTAMFHNQPYFAPFNLAYTALFNTLALPAVQCPIGIDGNGIPIGVQIIGSPGMDQVLLRVAQELEKGFGGWRKPTNNTTGFEFTVPF